MSIEIITEKMVFGGDCIAHVDGKTYFVPYAIPGEKLEVEVVKELSDYSVCEIRKVLEPSPHRTLPFCPLYGKCGGCNMQHIDARWQQELRKSILKDAFAREGVEVGDIEVISGSSTGYRTRFQFHSGGLMGKRSNEVVPLENCPCASEEINKYLKEVPQDQRPEGRIQVFGSGNIVSVPDGFDKIIIAECREQNEKQDAWNTRKERRIGPNGRLLKKQRKVKARYAGSVQNEETLATVSILGKSVTFDVQGFFQSNMEVLEKALPAVVGGLEGKNVLDMYSGAGTFSVFLADKFDNVTMVEHNKGAVVYAEQNMAGKKHESFGVSGEVWTKYHAEGCIKKNGPFDAVVIDPPRSGMEKAVCQWIQSSGIKHVRSVSCDTATHARDAKFLVRSGYRLEKLYLLDFYPQTCHIESLGIFER